MNKLTEKPAIIDSAVEAETPGVILRRARLAAGFKKEQIASQLNLAVDKIKAMEQDKYHKFHSEVYVTGSLRAYANLLSVDADKLIATYDKFRRANKTAGDMLEPVIERRIPSNDHHAGKWAGMAIAVVVLLLWFLQPADRIEKPVITVAAIEDVPVEIDVRDRSVIDSLGELPNAALQPVVAQVSEREGDPAEDLLSLNFSGDCWVEVRDRDGQVILAEMRHAGDKVELTGLAPFKILLGYAPVVSMNYNGESININSNTRTNSARLVVGRS